MNSREKRTVFSFSTASGIGSSAKKAVFLLSLCLRSKFFPSLCLSLSLTPLCFHPFHLSFSLNSPFPSLSSSFSCSLSLVVWISLALLLEFNHPGQPFSTEGDQAPLKSTESFDLTFATVNSAVHGWQRIPSIGMKRTLHD